MKWTRIAPLVLCLLIGGFAGFRLKVNAPKPQRRILFYRDPMHPAYRSDKPGIAPDCGMPLEPVYADQVASALSSGTSDAPEAVIDPAVQRLYGIDVVPVSCCSQETHMRLFGRVQADETRIYSVEFGTDGFVKETDNDAVGTHVKKDQKLATVYSPEFLAVAGGYLAANEHFAGAANAETTQNAASVSARADRLRNLGMSDSQIDEISKTHKLPEDVYVASPTDGFILSRSISPGMRFERHDLLYSIADLSQVWILADAFGRDAEALRMGMKARVTVPDTNQTFTARVALVLPDVDPATRAVKVRLQAENPAFQLRPGMFVNVDFPIDLPRGITVPADAIVDSGTSRRVYVRTEGSHFEPRIVQTGWQIGDRVQVVAGLHEGDSVVSAGTFLVDSETRLHETNGSNDAHRTK
jgi:Cu(I)/Ag(I) efflux system membrane fusion protein